MSRHTEYRRTEQLEDRCLLSAVVGSAADENHPIEVHVEMEDFDGAITIESGQSQTVIGPHHTDPGHSGSQTHFFAETGDAHHFAWQDQDPSTSDVMIDIYYDFRDLGGRWGANVITPGQIAMAELALDKWETATAGKIQFTQNTTASADDIIIIGTGNLRALGFRSSPGGILGLGGGIYTHNSDHTITGGIAWQDYKETWDEVNGNGDQSGTFDYFTVVAQEVGHALGLGHVDDLGGTNIMNGTYTGEVAEYSTNDFEHIQSVYGVGGPVDQAPTVNITSPGNNTQFESGVTIDFAGTASDPEEGDLTDDLIWTSNIDGQIGVGGSFSTTLSDGNHTITASVTDSAGNTTSQSITLLVGDAPADATAVIVDSVSYTTNGGKNGDKDLSVTIALLDNLGDPTSGASVSITLNLDSGSSWSGTATTGTDGTVTFKLRNAPKGTYSTVVDNVTASGLTWDGVTPTNGYSKSYGKSSGGEATVNTPADAPEVFPVFFVYETTEPAKLDPTNEDAESNPVVLSVLASADWNASETDSDDLISDYFDDFVTEDSEPVMNLPQDLDEVFSDLLTSEWALL